MTHQLVRSRLHSFSQESQRYVDLTKSGASFVRPLTPDCQGRYVQAWNDAVDHYMVLRETYKTRKEDARFVLPNMAQTRIVMSGPLHAWRHFIWQRCDKAAQWEIRNHALEVLKYLDRIFPFKFAEEVQAFLT